MTHPPNRWASSATRRQPDDDLLGSLSYRGLRFWIGALALGLPPVLVVGQLVLDGRQWPDSISAYYYTSMRDVFVGVLFVLGAFLFSYRYRPRDNRLSNIASVLVLTVALVPTSGPGPERAGEQWLQALHLGSAVAFFAVLAYFSLRVFTQHGPGPLTPRKLQRDRVYRGCGRTIVVALAFAGLNAALGRTSYADDLRDVNALFWCQSVAVWAFAVAWLVKSGWVLPDLKPPAPAG